MFQKNKSGRQVPIVQTGAAGMHVGSLLIDVIDKHNFEIIEYKLHTVSDEVKKNLQMQEFVEKSYRDLANFFNRNIAMN